MRKQPEKKLRPVEGSSLIGAHFSISGGLENALKDATRYRSIVCQIFTKNANTWRERVISAAEAERFDLHRKAHGIRSVAAHTAYLINLASPEEEIAEKSRDALIHEMERSDALGLSYVVLHPGAHKGSGETEGIRKIREALISVLDITSGLKPRLLLETTAGQGSSIGHRFEQLAEIMAAVGKPERMGVCLDTSHIFAAGYDIRTPALYRKTLARFDAVIGLRYLKLIHLNDSRKALGTRVDRHAHIGLGHIGLPAFKLIVNDPRLRDVPKILETPKEKGGKDWDAINLKQLRRMIRRTPDKSRKPGD